MTKLIKNISLCTICILLIFIITLGSENQKINNSPIQDVSANEQAPTTLDEDGEYLTKNINTIIFHMNNGEDITVSRHNKELYKFEQVRSKENVHTRKADFNDVVATYKNGGYVLGGHSLTIYYRSNNRIITIPYNNIAYVEMHA